MEFELSLWHKLRQSLDIYKSSAWVFSYLYGLLYHKDTAVSVPFLDIHVKTCMFVLWRVLRGANGFPYKHKTQISLRTMPKYNGMGVKSNNSTLTSARGVAKSAISQAVPFNFLNVSLMTRCGSGRRCKPLLSVMAFILISYENSVWKRTGEKASSWK